MATCTTPLVTTYSTLFPHIPVSRPSNPKFTLNLSGHHHPRALGVTPPPSPLSFPLPEWRRRQVPLFTQRTKWHMNPGRDPLLNFSCLRVSNSPPAGPLGKLEPSFRGVQKWSLSLRSCHSPPRGLGNLIMRTMFIVIFPTIVSISFLSQPVTGCIIVAWKDRTLVYFSRRWSRVQLQISSIIRSLWLQCAWMWLYVFLLMDLAYSPSIRNAVKELHLQGVTHGDIAGRNIIVHERKTTLIDFGNALITTQSERQREDLDAVDRL